MLEEKNTDSIYPLILNLISRSIMHVDNSKPLSFLPPKEGEEEFMVVIYIYIYTNLVTTNT